MIRKLVVTNYENNRIFAVFEDNRLMETSVLKEGNESLLGNIYVARVENVVKNINAAFVEIAKGVKCYYSLTDNTEHIFLNRKNSDKVCIGDLVLVQVSKDAIKTKMAAVTSKLNISGQYVAASFSGRVGVSEKITDEEKRTHLSELIKPLLKDRLGFVIRTKAADAADEEITSEAKLLSELLIRTVTLAKHRTAFTCMYKTADAAALNGYSFDDFDEIVTDDTTIYGDILSVLNKKKPEEVIKLKLYEDKLLSLDKLYNLRGRINDAMRKRVWLKSGGYLIIEPTEALTVIDVNTGKYDGRKADREATFLKVNLEAAIELAYQLHLRNYSGIIIVDFIDMEIKENNQLLLDTLKEQLSKDKIKTTVVDMTRLGLVEITRKRVSRPLHEEFSFLTKVTDN